MTLNVPPAPTPHGDVHGRRERAEKWLLKAAKSQNDAVVEWTEQGVALLTAGREWDVVRAPYTALGPDLERCTDVQELRRHAEELGGGAVWCDRYRRCLYFLVPPGTDRGWPQDRHLAGVECLGGTPPYIHYVGVPRVDRIEPSGFFWLAPLDSASQVLADPRRLYEALLARAGASQSPPPNTP
ncbi:hypothetical protein [Streptomyces murinus]|uniref:hypothetical protein n=1 Tax=Streptomyces murinus TaxID=33900 RepID=UPI00380B3E62